MDIQLCCFLAVIYVYVHLLGCQNKSKCFQILKSSNVFYARSRQMMPVGINGSPTNGSARSKYFRNIVPPGSNILKIFGPPLNKVSSHGFQLGLGLGLGLG